MRTIILAAGQGYKLGGFNKVLLKDPKTGMSIMDNIINSFSDTEITVVVGFNCTNIMIKYPKLKYIYNKNWHITKDSYSLALALDDKPSYILHSDVIFEENLRESIDNNFENCALLLNNQNRNENSINCSVLDNKIIDVYKGPILKSEDFEFTGIYKVFSEEILNAWKKNCLKNPTKNISENLPYKLESEIYPLNAKSIINCKVKTPIDYINYLNYINKYEN